MKTLIARLVGMLEIAGGLFGLFIYGARAFQLRAPLPFALMLLGALAFALVLVAGVRLLEGDERGWRWSSWLQLAQIPILATPLVTYGWSVGATAGLVVRLGSGWSFGYRLPSAEWMLRLGEGRGWFLGVNFIAVIAFLLLRLARR
ncbi:MAG: hypothetical protein KGI40_07675 [Xanthomonadaceae bacterium]|nr:hypothetical protein [Xanthomonadaceae bacterium]MDE2178230.1 hypothetical protein [Xanthomonadaceae bacterium]MDE2246240.1 hypothetical protein [Xanthomonadaceae bacterium]